MTDLPDGAGPGARVRRFAWTRRLPVAPEVAWARFHADLWIGGAGFGPRPVVEEPGDAFGIGAVRRIGVGPRGGVREAITGGDPPRRLEYRVANPSWTTFPVRWHRGTVAFEATGDGGTEVRWAVELEPLPGAGPFVAVATRWVIGRYLDALEGATRAR